VFSVPLRGGKANDVYRGMNFIRRVKRWYGICPFTFCYLHMHTTAILNCRWNHFKQQFYRYIGNEASDHKNLINMQILRSVQSRPENIYIKTTIMLSTIYNFTYCKNVICAVICVRFCKVHFVMVPLNLTFLHCLQHF